MISNLSQFLGMKLSKLWARIAPLYVGVFAQNQTSESIHNLVMQRVVSLRNDGHNPTTLVIPRKDFDALIALAGPSSNCSPLDDLTYMALTVEFVQGPFKGVLVH